MAEYAALFRPGEDVTFTVAALATVKGGDLVAVVADRQVAQATPGSTPIGVALFDAASGEKVTVATGGVHRLVAGDAIGAGNTVAAGALGTVVAGASGSNSPVGIAVTSSAGTPVAHVDVLLTVGGLGLDADTVYTLPAAGAALGGVKQAAAQADSTATDVAGLVADFNSLLAKLRTAGILAAS